MHGYVNNNTTIVLRVIASKLVLVVLSFIIGLLLDAIAMNNI